MLELVAATCDPSDTLAVGALIDKAPAVSVKVAGVAAPAGKATRAVVAARKETAPARHRSCFMVSRPFFVGKGRAGTVLRLRLVGPLGPDR